MLKLLLHVSVASSASPSVVIVQKNLAAISVFQTHLTVGYLRKRLEEAFLVLFVHMSSQTLCAGFLGLQRGGRPVRQ